MWLFRKSLDISRASPRRVTANDLGVISRLFRDGGRRFAALSGNDLPALLAAGQGVAMVAGGELWAVALVSQPCAERCWLRAIAFAEGVDARAGSNMLLPALHRSLAALGVRGVYFGGDESAEHWLLPILSAHGYQYDTEVLVYEKRQLDVPATGNPLVQLRPAGDADLASLLQLDQACFEPQWTKDDTILQPAIRQGPYFVVAELAGALVGYAYATTHFGGQLVHLVRIAVAPEHQHQQIGVSLLADVIAFAREQGAVAVTLNTQAYNVSAQRLYRWFGFSPTGERQAIVRCDL
ncbi:MAG: GNAT family N-acetyltransferase [Chloroflexi bacterium]|nr:GNAT family N-acetyltransferase [Chloroflexota bacterium]